MDQRDRQQPRWLEHDHKNMCFWIRDADFGDGSNVRDVQIPTHYEMCDVCQGKGHHVNPDIDRHGISEEEFYDDPDFREEYMSGTYDVTCRWCRGEKVVMTPSAHADKKDVQFYYDIMNLDNEEQRQEARCMGEY